jgi:pyrroloquinoline quinone (PQQ) biosynthesis protein C
MIETGTLTDGMIAIVKRYMDHNPWLEYAQLRLTREGAQIYAQQHGIFTRHSRRCWAYVVGNCPEVEVRRFIVRENLYDEEGIEARSHYLKLVKLAAALGLPPDAMHDAVPTAGLRAAMLIWETLTKDRHWLIGAAAKASLEMLNLPACGTFSLTQTKNYIEKLGLTKEDLDFHTTHDELDKVHGSGALELLERYLPCCPEVTLSDVLTAVEDSIFAMELFQGGAAKAAAAL